MKPPVNGKIQGLFKANECFSSTFQGKFNFQGLFKKALYIQVFSSLFQPWLKRAIRLTSMIPVIFLVFIFLLHGQTDPHIDGQRDKSIPKLGGGGGYNDKVKESCKTNFHDSSGISCLCLSSSGSHSHPAPDLLLS